MCDLPVVDKACHLLGSATQAVAGSAFQAVVDAFAKGLADVMKALMTFWIHTPEPNLSSSGVIPTLDNLTRPLVAFGALLGLIVAGVRLAWTARHEQSAQSILRGLLLMTIVTAGGATIVEVLLSGLDLMAVAVLDHGFDGVAVGDRLTALGALPGAGGGLVFLLAFFGMIASLAQVGVMLVRGAILAVLVGVLPVAAGASITEAGYAWFKRLCGWILSFCVYRLVAALVYAAAFTMIGTGTDLAGIVAGFSLIVVAILALPALLRLIPPAAESMGGAGSGGGLAGLTGAAATGAVMLAGRGGSSSGPPVSTTPGLKADAGPTGSDGAAGTPSGDTPAAGGGGAATGAGKTSAVGTKSGAAAAGTAAGGVGAAAAVGQQVHSGAKALAGSSADGGASQ